MAFTEDLLLAWCVCFSLSARSWHQFGAVHDSDDVDTLDPPEHGNPGTLSAVLEGRPSRVVYYCVGHISDARSYIVARVARHISGARSYIIARVARHISNSAQHTG